MDNIPTDILVYAVIAVVLLVWLGRTIGTRNGSERQRPNPFTVQPDAPKKSDGGIHPVSARLPGDDVSVPHDKDAVTSAVDAGLVQIALADRTFDSVRFVENAKDAFSMVVTSFAEGDRATLRDLLSPEVYKSFDAEITRRDAAGQKAVTEVLSVRDAVIIDAALKGPVASITLRFKADETYVLTDATGKTIAGHPDRVVTMTDVWTFSRDVKRSDPRWLVSETRDDVKEEDGRTLPDAGIRA